jgi:hypothetical protein
MRRLELVQANNVLSFAVDGRRLDVVIDQQIIDQAIKGAKMYPAMIDNFIHALNKRLYNANTVLTADEVRWFVDQVRAKIFK